MDSAIPGRLDQRIDQWLWFARVTKSRTLAQVLIERGKVRLNRERLAKASQTVKAGDVLTVSLGPNVRVLEVVALGARRGPASEASKLFRELTAPAAQPMSERSTTPLRDAQPSSPPAVRDPGSGRPTKRDRREIDRLKKW